MLTSTLISLTAESSYPILGALGRPAQAWFLGLVTRANPTLASSLHDEQGLKPYTVSTLLDDYGRPLAENTWLKPGQTCWIRITTLNENMAKLMHGQILPKLPDRLTLYKMNFRLDGVARNRAEHPWAGTNSFSEIAQQASLVAPGQTLRLEFASPTAFRSNGLDICLPQPGQIFRSLWDKWNTFCPGPMRVQDAWPQFAENCLFVNELTAVNTIRWVFAEGSHGEATGFTGTTAFFLPQKQKLPKQWQDFHEGAATVMQSLGQFAFYSGVGHHATIGMGQCRLLVPHDRKITKFD